MALRFPIIGNRRKQGLNEECEGGSSDGGGGGTLKFLEFLERRSNCHSEMQCCPLLAAVRHSASKPRMTAKSFPTFGKD